MNAPQTSSIIHDCILVSDIYSRSHRTGIQILYNAQNTQEIFYILTDHLNTPRKLTDSNGVVVWSWNSDAFGVTSDNTDVDGDGTKVWFRLRFPGQYYDFETGAHYNYFRDYEPGTGRYLQSDPIGLEGGSNTYGYVLNNPLINFDPEGTDVWVEGGLHLRVCVETPKEKRAKHGGVGVKRLCISFAAEKNYPWCFGMCSGATYPDFGDPGEKRQYKETNPYQDIFIEAYLLSNTDDEYWYSLLGFNCRTFSNDIFESFDENY